MQLSPLASGVQGVLRANELAADASSRIAQAGTTNPDQDLVTPVVDLLRAERLAEASARVIETEQRTLGSLLDVKA